MLEESLISKIKQVLSIKNGWIKKNGETGVTNEYKEYFYLVPTGNNTVTEKGCGLMEATENYNLIVGASKPIKIITVLNLLSKSGIFVNGNYNENTEEIYLNQTDKKLQAKDVFLIQLTLRFTGIATNCKNECIFIESD